MAFDALFLSKRDRLLAVFGRSTGPSSDGKSLPDHGQRVLKLQWTFGDCRSEGEDNEPLVSTRRSYRRTGQQEENAVDSKALEQTTSELASKDQRVCRACTFLDLR